MCRISYNLREIQRVVAASSIQIGREVLIKMCRGRTVQHRVLLALQRRLPPASTLSDTAEGVLPHSSVDTTFRSLLSWYSPEPVNLACRDTWIPVGFVSTRPGLQKLALRIRPAWRSRWKHWLPSDSQVTIRG